MSNNQVETELDIAVKLEKKLTIPSGITDAESESIYKKNEIKLQFNKDLCKKLGKTFDMSPLDKIEKRGINRVQLEHVRDVLINKNNQENYYNWTRIYEIKEILGTKYLFSKKINKTSETSGRIVPLEDMYDVLVDIHTKVGNQGRNDMLHEAAKSYGNITRPIIELS